MGFKTTNTDSDNSERIRAGTVPLRVYHSVTVAPTQLLCVMKQGGNVGIGTTSPSTKLHVEHYGSAIGDFEGLRIANHATNLHSTSRPAYEFVVSDIDNGTGIGNSKFSIGIEAQRQHREPDRLVIDNAGNVGIGTTNPLNKLDVRSDNYATFGKATYNAAGWSGIRLGTPYTTNHDAYCSVIESYNNHAADYNSILRFKTSNGNNAAATERMRIASNGCIGIGTSDPGSCLLNVQGGAAHFKGNAPGVHIQPVQTTGGGKIYSLDLELVTRMVEHNSFKFCI